MTDAVVCEQDGSVVTLTLNRPDTRNAITEDICESLVALCDRINHDLSVRCIILTGAGKGFSSGGNIKDMRDRTSLFGGSAAQIRSAYREGIQRMPLAMYRLEVPIIAAVNGAAIGAGFDIAMMCDMRIASTRASFAEVFVKLGIIPGDGGAWFLPRAIGMARAAEMSFTGPRRRAAYRALVWIDRNRGLVISRCACGAMRRFVARAAVKLKPRKRRSNGASCRGWFHRKA